MKTCCRCGSPGPFNVNRSRKDGLDSMCRACAAARQARWRAEHPESVEAKRMKRSTYYAQNKSTVKAQQKAWRDANKAKVSRSNRRVRLQRFYGLTREQVDAMLNAQNNRCVICQRDFDSLKSGWNVDHCHKTGKVRGLLCRVCNLGLGALRDDVIRLERALSYLRAHAA